MGDVRGSLMVMVEEGRRRVVYKEGDRRAKKDGYRQSLQTIATTATTSIPDLNDSSDTEVPTTVVTKL